jgi:hypothetical protein
LAELAAAEAAGKARGYPSLVTLETRDDILQCVPLHVAAERGQLSVVQVGIHGDQAADPAAAGTYRKHGSTSQDVYACLTCTLQDA